ncbi:MAG: glycosyltransferase [Nitrososphaeria archaeon]
MLGLFIRYLFLAAGVMHLGHSSRKRKEDSSLSREGLPMVSIVVPVKNEEKVVERLLKALLRLDYPIEKREIIIVEGGSNDKTVKICRNMLCAIQTR